MTLIVVLFAMESLLSGCAPHGISQSTYNEKIRLVTMGMSKQAFYDLFPESVPRGAKQYPTGIVEVLQVDVEYYSFFPTGNPNRNEWTGMEGRPQWFYFFHDELIQYGQPDDWPSKPDKIVELRER